MNRQARLKGDTCWTSFGEVTLHEAAIQLYKRSQYDDARTIEVRCESDPQLIRAFTITIQPMYRAEGLRGGM